jgi:hypothetical protein
MPAGSVWAPLAFEQDELEFSGETYEKKMDIIDLCRRSAGPGQFCLRLELV